MILPASVESENAVLGAVLTDWSGEQLDYASHKVDSVDFYSEVNRKLWMAIQKCKVEHGQVDTVLLKESLEEDIYLHAQGLAAKATGATFFESHVSQITKFGALRQIITTCQEVQSAAITNSDPTEVLDFAGQKLADLVRTKDRDFRNTAQVVESLKYQYENPQKNPSTGILALDEILTGGGLSPSEVTVVAAATGLGKSAFMSNSLVLSYLLQGKNVACFSLEMNAEDILRRMVAAKAKLDLKKLSEGELSEAQRKIAYNSMDSFVDMGLFVDDSSSITIESIKRKTRALNLKNPLDLVVIDYVQLLGADYATGNRNTELTAISRNIKNLQREIGCAVVCLAQLSRAVHSRPDKRPMLQDLRESGALEQDAGIVIMLYREGYYEKDCEEPNKVELIVRKQRNGSIGTADAYWHDSQARFADIGNDHHRDSSLRHWDDNRVHN